MTWASTGPVTFVPHNWEEATIEVGIGPNRNPLSGGGLPGVGQKIAILLEEMTKKIKALAKKLRLGLEWKKGGEKRGQIKKKRGKKHRPLPGGVD